MLRPGIRATIIVALLGFAGCSRNVYEIELRPKDDAIERDLTAWREGSGASSSSRPDEKPSERVEELPEAELKRIAAAYGEAPPPVAAKKHHFRGAFRGALPNDVGGAGSFARWQSPLGDLYAYAERVRGNDDLAADLDARRAAVDRVVDILIGWLDGELKDDPIAPKLHALLDGPVRGDATNLALDYWSITAALRSRSLDDQGVWDDLLFRSAQYLVERRYFTPEELPLVIGAIDNGDNPAVRKRMLELLRAAASRKLGLDDEHALDGLIALLGDADRVERTLNEFVKTTPEYGRLVSLRKRKAEPGETPMNVEAADVFDDLILMNVLRLDINPDRLRAKLHVPVAPAVTNGEYDADTRAVTWEHPIDAADAELPGMPYMMYAAWATPNEAAQSRYFGKVILQGEPLAQYVLWYRGLTADEQTAWSGLLESLPGKPDPKGVIKAYRFPAGASGKSGNAANRGRRLLLAALGDGDGGGN